MIAFRDALCIAHNPVNGTVSQSREGPARFAGFRITLRTPVGIIRKAALWKSCRCRHNFQECVLYQTVGCGRTIASGPMLTKMIAGNSIAGCWELTIENLIERLDGIPPDKLHWLALAIGALKDAPAKWANSEGVSAEMAEQSR